MRSTPQQDEGRGEARRAGRVGRRVALGLYFLVVLYITTVAFYSVVPQAFFRGGAAPAEPLDCRSALSALHAELRRHAAGVVGGGPNEPSFWAAWDDRYHGLRSHCDHESYGRLGRLRYRIETTLRRYAREEGALSRALEHALGDTAQNDLRP